MDPNLAFLRRWAAARWRRRVPWGLGGIVARLARLFASVGAVGRVLRFARRFTLGPVATARLLVDCWASGAQPNEAFVWRRFCSPPGVHPLPGRAAALLLPHLGDSKAHDLLADKMASDRFLVANGLPTPTTLGVIACREEVDVTRLPWTRSADLIVKPRHGAAGRGVLAITASADQSFRLGGERIGAMELARRLRRITETDDALIQERLRAADDAADLATEGRAPVLRLTTAREPAGAPFLYAALLEIDVPGERPHHFIRGRVRAPIDPESGVLQDGLWFLHPERRLSRLPWNNAPLAGRVVPGFDAAVDAVLRAATLLPGLPLGSWDVIVSADGPKILEGNSAGDWILGELPRCVGLRPPPLAPVLRRWIPP